MRIDLDAILRSRTGKRIPRIVTRLLESIIRQDDLNGILSRAFPARGSAFADAAVADLGITLEVKGLDELPERRRFIFASNHPLGALDGVSLLSVLGTRWDDSQIRLLVNDMLMNLEPLTDVFLPINKYGAQGRAAARQINEVYAGDAQVLIFPAGLVSRLGPSGIRDLKWQKAFVAKALEYGRDVVPVRFEGLNSMSFYRLAQWRKRLGIKVNIEQIRLPAEVMNTRGKTFRVVFGKPIAPEELARLGSDPSSIADAVKQIVYSLK